MTPIISSPTASLASCLEWAEQNNAAQHWINEAIPAMWMESWIVDPLVLIAQGSHETGFGTYGRALTEDHHSTGGIKIRDPSGYNDDDSDAHQRFASWNLGARAHRQHLLAYCGIYPEHYGEVLVDPRLVWVRGIESIRYVEDLGGKWAPDPGYGRRLVDKMHQIRGAE